MRHPYLKILDLANLFVADAPMKKSRNLFLPPSQSTLKYGSENQPWMRGLTNFLSGPDLSTPPAVADLQPVQPAADPDTTEDPATTEVELI